MIQVFSNGTNNAPSTSATNYSAISYPGFGPSRTWSTSFSARSVVMPTSGTLRNIYVEISNAPGTGKSYTFNLGLNGFIQSSTNAVISDSNTSAFSTASLRVSAGDYVYFRCVPSGTPDAVTYVKWSVEFEADCENDFVILGGSGNFFSVSATEYHPIMGGTNWVGGYIVAPRVPMSLYVKRFYIRCSTALSSGSLDVSVHSFNGSSDKLTATITSASQSAVSSYSPEIISNGDILYLKSVPSSPDTASALSWGILCTPVEPGKSWSGGATSDGSANGTVTEYNVANSSGGVSYGTTESDFYQLATGKTQWDIRDISCISNTVPTSGTLTFGIRRDGSEPDTSLVAELTSSNQLDSTTLSGSTLPQAVFRQGNDINIYAESNSLVIGGNGTAWSYSQYVPVANGLFMSE